MDEEFKEMTEDEQAFIAGELQAMAMNIPADPLAARRHTLKMVAEKVLQHRNLKERAKKQREEAENHMQKYVNLMATASAMECFINSNAPELFEMITPQLKAIMKTGAYPEDIQKQNV